MKNRNKLVSALLTGMLIGGAAAGASGDRVLADNIIENSADEAGEDGGEASAPSQPASTPTPTPTPAPTPAPSEPAPSQPDSTGSGVDGSGDSSGQGENSGGTDTGSGETGDGGSESGGESIPDSHADPSSFPENPSSDAEDPSSVPDSTDPENPESLPESTSSETELSEEEEPVEDTTEFPGGYIYTGGGYAYLTADYHYRGMSSDQWKLYIKYGFHQVAKVYAVANVPEKLNIRDGKSLDAEIVGEMPPFALCYILADQDDEWVYVESGGVRGFVYKELLITGKKAEQIVRKHGEFSLPQAVQLVEPADNKAFRYSMNTVYNISEEDGEETGAAIDRDELAGYARGLIGSPYAWNGTSLSEGTDSANLIRQVYEHFGVELPDTAYALASAGTRIVADEAQAGDLIYYEKDGIVYHVLLYLGGGKGLDATSESGIVDVVDVDWRRVCWAGRIIENRQAETDETVQEVTAGSLERAPLAAAASEGDEAAAGKIISMLADASEKEWEEYGFCRSVIIAQSILESNWCSFSTASEQGIRPEDNNVLGMNASLMNDLWESPWSGSTADRMIPSENEGMIIWTKETMRTYPDIASCLADYAAFKTALHPELRGETDYRTVLEEGFPGYSPDSAYIRALTKLIETYDLTRFDEDASPAAVIPEEKEADLSDAMSAGSGFTPSDEEDPADGPEYALPEGGDSSTAEAVPEEPVPDAAEDMPQEEGIEFGADVRKTAALSAAENSESETVTAKDSKDGKVELTDNGDGTWSGPADDTVYTQQEMELIWAVVAEEDDTSYDGALAVISCVMNRVDENYGGFGKTALAQLKAEGQFCYSAAVSDPIYYQRRLGGNVPDYVKQAISDCLTQGIRSHTYDGIGNEGEKQIGSRWYS